MHIVVDFTIINIVNAVLLLSFKILYHYFRAVFIYFNGLVMSVHIVTTYIRASYLIKMVG